MSAAAARAPLAGTAEPSAAAEDSEPGPTQARPSANAREEAMSEAGQAAEGLVELVVEESRWFAAVPGLAALAERAARRALAEQGLDPGRWSVAILACDDARMAELNAAWRGRPGPTNVLSWPAFALAPPAPGARPPLPRPGPGVARTPLGDVAIALGTVEREAAAAGRPLAAHVFHLVLHGCLHLLGFDHEREEDAALMEAIEERALAEAGFNNHHG